MRTWKYGISFAESTPLSAPLPLDGNLYEAIEKATELGYDAVEFHTREDFSFDFQRLERMKRAGRGGICALVTGRLYTQGGLSLLDQDEDAAAAAVLGIQSYIDKARQLGVDIVLGWAKGNVPPGGDRAVYLDRLASKLRILDAYAGERNVRILTEVINHYETNIFNTARETLRFFEENRLDHCYIHLDTYHMGLEELDPYYQRMHAQKSSPRRVIYPASIDEGISVKRLVP